MRFLPLAALFLLSSLLRGADPRGDNPDAAPQTPEQELAHFHLPPGFEIQLVAAEPEIQKPINLNFDAAGRLWVTGSELYPWPASTDAAGNPIPDFAKAYEEMAGAFNVKGKAPAPSAAARDSVRILSDFGADGRARKVEIFADGLNIPSGVQPLPRAPGAKGDSAIVYSIPYIWRLEDRDGDGRAEHREILFGPFGYLDTHGGSSSYIYWMDGWIYGTHGFRNHSEVRDKNGKVLTLDSGNTYRFKPDGSAFEQYTHGQTNPFGLAFDPMGNLYSADSHSKPVYLLLRGGYYEGIAKQHDGLGFAPRITDDDHGSSAIAGIAYYADDKFPEEFRGNLFNGNPVTRRINRDKLEWHGSTPKAIRQEDFLTSDDPWFRPVQVKLGPDGALYIADFYNAVIGHYEFPLADPRRDHTHGRIWRIVYKGAKHELPRLAEAEPARLVRALRSSNLEARRLAVNELVDRLGRSAIVPLSRFLETDPVFEERLAASARPKPAGANNQAPQGNDGAAAAFFAALTRLRPVMNEDQPVERAVADVVDSGANGVLRGEAAAVRLRALADGPEYEGVAHFEDFLAIVLSGEAPASELRVAAECVSTVLRSLAQTAGDGPLLDPADAALCLRALLICRAFNSPEDTELVHAVRMALRDCLLMPNGYTAAAAVARFNPQAAEHLSDVSLGVPTPESASFLLDRLGRGQLTSPRAGDYVRHVAAYIAEDRLPEVANLVKDARTISEQQRFALAAGFAEAARKRGAKLTAETTAWIDTTLLVALTATDHEVLRRALTAARDLKSEGKLGVLYTLRANAQLPRDLRMLALEASVNTARAADLFELALNDTGDLAVRGKAAELLGKIDSDEAREALLHVLPSAPGELAVSIAGALVQREKGARALVEAVAAGKASPTLLRNKLAAMMIERVAPDLMPRLGKLTTNLPSEDARLDRAIAARVEAFERVQRSRPGLFALDLAHGAQLFKTTCAVCHKFRNEGANVGPNLDGVAARGLPRLVEDILDPNRNVDPAFRQVTIETSDGRTLAGINPREEGGNLLLSDATGATLSVPKGQVKSRTESRLSLMPTVFEQALSADDLNDLVAFLITPAK